LGISPLSKKKKKTENRKKMARTSAKNGTYQHSTTGI
jgi:hypothetical protein